MTLSADCFPAGLETKTWRMRLPRQLTRLLAACAATGILLVGLYSFLGRSDAHAAAVLLGGNVALRDAADLTSAATTGARGDDGKPPSCQAIRADQPLLRYVCESARLYRNVLVMTWTNYAIANLTTNWMLSLHRVGFNPHHALVLCGDVESSDYFGKTLHNLTTFDVSPTSPVWKEIGWPQDFVVPVYNRQEILWPFSVQAVRISRSRFAIMTYLVANGFTVFFQDVDTVHPRRTPENGVDRAIDYLTDKRMGNPHWLVSLNRPAIDEFVEYNMGYSIMRPTRESLELANATIATMYARPNDDDQSIINDVLLKFNETRYLSSTFCKALPYEEFTPGKYTFLGGMYDRHRFWKSIQSKFEIEDDPAIVVPHMLHVNWIVAEIKIAKLREWYLWFADDHERFCAAKLLLCDNSAAAATGTVAGSAGAAAA